MKKYKVVIGSDEFECDGYIVHHTCVEFIMCGNENYEKIVPTNVEMLIYPIKKLSHKLL